MVLLWMWLILEIVDGLDEIKKRAGAIDLYVFSWKVLWTPDKYRIVRLLIRILLALGMQKIQRQRLALKGLQASQLHSTNDPDTDHDHVSRGR